MSVFDLEKIREELSVYNRDMPCAMKALQLLIRLCEEGQKLEAENAELRLKVEELGELCARKTRRLDHQDKVISSQILENAALKRELAGEMEKY